jgi:hypothetical protein
MKILAIQCKCKKYVGKCTIDEFNNKYTADKKASENIIKNSRAETTGRETRIEELDIYLKDSEEAQK